MECGVCVLCVVFVWCLCGVCDVVYVRYGVCVVVLRVCCVWCL